MSGEAVQLEAGDGPPAATKAKADGGIDIPLPMVSMQRVHVPVPGAQMSRLAEAAAATVPKAVSGTVPPGGKLLYFTGLAALAAFEIVSWPVAAAIGTGVWVASRTRKPAGADK